VKINPSSLLIIYSSFSKNSASYNVANYISNKLNISKINIYEKKNLNKIKRSKIYLIIASTMGDQELSPQMENFFLSIKKLKLKKKKYFAAELGNYYGYDDYTFGAQKIIDSFLPEIGIKKIFKTNSIDTMPKINWFQVEKWLKSIKRNIL
jgi:flavodoxin